MSSESGDETNMTPSENEENEAAASDINDIT